MTNQIFAFRLWKRCFHSLEEVKEISLLPHQHTHACVFVCLTIFISLIFHTSPNSDTKNNLFTYFVLSKWLPSELFFIVFIDKKYCIKEKISVFFSLCLLRFLYLFVSGVYSGDGCIGMECIVTF